MKNIHLQGTWIIKAPREKVYAVMSDFDNFPKYFPAVAQHVQVVKKEGNHLTIEAQTKSFGRTFTVNMNTQLRPPFGYISDNVSGIGSSGHEEFLMEEVPGGTRINYTYDVDFKNPVLRTFGKVLIGWYAMRYWKHAVIDRLEQIVEK